MRVVLIVAAGLCLAGCSSTDLFKTTPPQVTLQMDSTPPGADAVTSVGPGCKTPCSVQVPAGENFTVTYNLPKYQPATVEVTVVKQSGADPILDPNPAVAELVAVTPPKKPKRKPHAKPKPKAAAPAAQPAAPAAAAAPPPPGLSPFPPVR
jgi:hypothetical protein